MTMKKTDNQSNLKEATALQKEINEAFERMKSKHHIEEVCIKHHYKQLIHSLVFPKRK